MKVVDVDTLLFTVQSVSFSKHLNKEAALKLVRIAIEENAVDAVKVVRCKDCMHWKHFDHLGCTDFAKVCMRGNYMIGENGYCHYGERKDDGNGRDAKVL